MTTPATASSLREAISPDALTRARRRLLTAHPDPTSLDTSAPVSLTDEQLRLLAASDWVPPRIAALDASTLMMANPITRALLAESVCETLERRLAAERPHGTYDDTRAGHDAFSRGVVDDYDHGNHHLARHDPPGRSGSRDLCGTRGTGPARYRRHHYRRTRPGLGHQSAHADSRRRGAARP